MNEVALDKEQRRLMIADVRESPRCVKDELLFFSATADTREHLSMESNILSDLDDAITTVVSEPRRVRFALDENDDILTTAVPSELKFSEEDERNSWWTQDELMQQIRRARHAVMRCKAIKQEYQEGFVRLFTTCALSPHQLESYEFVDLKTHRAVRGLERPLHQILPRYKRKVIEAVLTIQSKLPRTLDSEKRSRSLAIKSSRLSRPSRRLARYLARQDTQEVFELVQEELAQTRYGARKRRAP